MVNDIKVKTPADLEIASENFLLGVMFTKSSSSSYKIAVSVAKGAARYYENDFDGTMAHFVLFDKTREEAIRAKSLLEYAKTWRSTQVFAGGKGLASAYRAISVLECYAIAKSCNDYRAHCYVVPQNYSYNFTEDQNLIFPCRFIYGFSDRRILANHPSSVEDQFQALAIRRGCDFCPYFNAELNTGPQKKTG